jgi:uncharacterized protein (TIGR04222 family)
MRATTRATDTVSSVDVSAAGRTVPRQSTRAVVGVLGAAALAVVAVVFPARSAVAQSVPSPSVCNVISNASVRQQCIRALTNATVPPPAVVPTLPVVPSGVESITAYNVGVQVERSGSLLVHEAISYDFGVVPKHGIFRDIPVRFDYPSKTATDRVYPIDVVSVTASRGTPAQYATSSYRSSGVGYERIRIGDPFRTISGEHVYNITYRVNRVLNAFGDHDELVWNAIGGQWSVPIRNVTITVGAPAAITKILCTQGPAGSNQPCDSSRAAANTAAFSQAAIGANQAVTFTVAIPKEAVPSPTPLLEQRWTLARAFSLTTATVGVSLALLILIVGGFLVWLWRTGRDRRYRGSAVDRAFGGPDGEEERTPLLAHEDTPVEFTPPEDLRPGEVGTLVAMQPHPLDVTATIVDLAVRKYLVIEEVPAGAQHWLRKDWTISRGKATDADLKPYEQDLLKALLHSHDKVKLSSLKNHFASSMDKIKRELVDDAMAAGWFRGRPERLRHRVVAVGLALLVGGLAATTALARYTHAGLVGVPLVIASIVIIAGARWAPARTAKGSAVLHRVNGFRRFINESEKERARFAEQKNLFSEYLPYAIVFGATERWAKAFAGLDGEPADTSWYRSTSAFNYAAFTGAMEGFAVTTGGTLTSTPASTSGGSGFSGGGGAGGGAGGGGGGSW